MRALRLLIGYNCDGFRVFEKESVSELARKEGA